MARRTVYINKPIDWQTSNFTEQVKGFKFEVADDNYILGTPIFPFDVTATRSTMPAIIRSALCDAQSPANYAVVGAGSYAAPNKDSNKSILVTAENTLYNNVADAWEAQMTPTVWKRTGAVSAIGETTIWDPGATKKFRLMGFTYGEYQAAATVGGSTITLRDGTGGTDFHTLKLQDVAADSIPILYSVVYPGNGYLSAAAANKLILNLSAALSAGKCYISVYGTEE